MASVKYTALLNEIKGKIAGTVFKGGYGGNVICALPSVSSRSYEGKLTKADAGRVIKPEQNISALSTSWKSLTAEQRLSWSVAAPNYPFKNRFSETYIGSGFQVYMHLNMNLLNTANTKLAIAPVPEALATSPAFHFTVVAFPALELVLDGAFPAGCDLILSATGAMSPTNNQIMYKYKAIKIIESTAVFPLDVTDDYVNAKGSIPANAFINWKLQAVNKTTGQLALPVYFSTQL